MFWENSVFWFSLIDIIFGYCKAVQEETILRTAILFDLKVNIFFEYGNF